MYSCGGVGSLHLCAHETQEDTFGKLSLGQMDLLNIAKALDNISRGEQESHRGKSDFVKRSLASTEFVLRLYSSSSNVRKTLLATFQVVVARATRECARSRVASREVFSRLT